MLDKILNLKNDILKETHRSKNVNKENEFGKYLKEENTKISKNEVSVKKDEVDFKSISKEKLNVEENPLENEDEISIEVLGLINFSEIALEIKELLLKLEDKPLEIKEIHFIIKNIENGLIEMTDILKGNEDFENLLGEKLNGNKENIKKLEELVKVFSEVKNNVKTILEPIYNGLVHEKNLPIDKEVLNVGLDRNKKDGLKSLIVDLDNKLNEKGISIKELISKLEGLEKNFTSKESIENLGESTKVDIEEKPLDLRIISKEKSEIKVKSEEETLETIIKEETPKEDFSFFNKRLEALKKSEIKSDNPIIRKSSIEADLVKSIKYINRDGLKELTVKVYPRDLGEIVISISKEDGLLKAALKANSKDTYNIISQNTVELKKLLGDGGIRIENIDISLYEDTTFYNESEFKKEHRENREESSELLGEYIEEEIIEEEEKGILNFLA